MDKITRGDVVEFSGDVVTGPAYEKIVRLFYDYAHCIDDDRLEEWPHFFVDDCIYKIVPRENAHFGLPHAIIDYDHKGMLQDRIAVLRKAAIFSLTYDRHVVSNICVQSDGDDYRATASFVVYKTDIIDGTTTLFGTGKYMDKIVMVSSELKFKEKVVILDTYSVPNHLATPL